MCEPPLRYIQRRPFFSLNAGHSSPPFGSLSRGVLQRKMSRADTVDEPGGGEAAPKLDNFLAELFFSVCVAGSRIVDGHTEHVFNLVTMHNASPAWPWICAELVLVHLYTSMRPGGLIEVVDVDMTGMVLHLIGKP